MEGSIPYVSALTCLRLQPTPAPPPAPPCLVPPLAPMGVSGPPLHAFQHNPCCACLQAVSHIDIREALLTGPALRQLMRSREEQFDQRFADTFGQLSEQDLPPGILLAHTTHQQQQPHCHSRVHLSSAEGPSFLLPTPAVHKQTWRTASGNARFAADRIRPCSVVISCRALMRLALLLFHVAKAGGDKDSFQRVARQSC